MTDLTLYKPSTGEVIHLAVADASDVELSDARERTIPEIEEELVQARREVNAELLARLDRSRKWTRRVGDVDDGVQFDLRAPSPDAGTTMIDDELLDQILEEMATDGTIGLDAAAAALERTVVVVMKVDSRDEAEQLSLDAAKDPRTVSASYVRKPRAAGIRAIQKVPEDAARLAPAISRRPAGQRYVSVRRIERKAVTT